MTKPPDQMPAATGRGHLRASHADREQVIETLKAAFVQGRLTKAELDARVGQAFVARTYADLAVLTADLPAGLAGPGAPLKAASVPTHHPVNKPLMWSMSVLTLAGIASMGAAFLVLGDPLLVFGLLAVLFCAPVAGTLMLDSLHERRSAGQLPPRPAQRGQALEGERYSAPGDDLIHCQAHRDTRARRPRGHTVTRRVWRSVLARPASAGP